jgi:hypothetical protein
MDNSFRINVTLWRTFKSSGCIRSNNTTILDNATFNAIKLSNVEVTDYDKTTDKVTLLLNPFDDFTVEFPLSAIHSFDTLSGHIDMFNGMCAVLMHDVGSEYTVKATGIINYDSAQDPKSIFLERPHKNSLDIISLIDIVTMFPCSQSSATELRSTLLHANLNPLAGSVLKNKDQGDS